MGGWACPMVRLTLLTCPDPLLPGCKCTARAAGEEEVSGYQLSSSPRGPALPPVSCVISGKFLNLSESQFIYLTKKWAYDRQVPGLK